MNCISPLSPGRWRVKTVELMILYLLVVVSRECTGQTMRRHWQFVENTASERNLRTAGNLHQSTIYLLNQAWAYLGLIRDDS